MTQTDISSLEYPVFKGLQRPFEFMGLQGRYIYWAAGTAGGAVAGFMAGYFTFGFFLGLALATVIIGAGGLLIFLKQRKGLHSKATDKGVFVFARSRNIL